MRSFTYPARIRRDRAGRYLVTFPDLPRCATDGGTVAQALTEAADALEEAIAHRIAQGLEIPPPSPPKKGQRTVPLSAQMSAKAALYLALGATGLSKSALARRLGVGKPRFGECLTRATTPACGGSNKPWRRSASGWSSTPKPRDKKVAIAPLVLLALT
jgi:antitoxin HicB